MKILFIASGASMLGANRSLLALLIALQNEGINPIVCCPNEGDFTNILTKNNIAYWIVPFKNWAFSKYVSIDYWRYLFNKKKLFKELNQSVSLLKKLVLETKDIKAIYSNSSVIGIGAMLAQSIDITHIWHIREFGEADYNLQFMLGRDYFNTLANQSKIVFCVSNAIKNQVLPDCKAPVYALHNGLFTSDFIKKIPIQSFSITNPFEFIIMGLLHPAKAQLQALRAFKTVYHKNNNCKLNIVGSGRRIYTLRLRWYIRLHKLENVVTMLPHTKQPLDVIASAHVLLMCSPSEGMGRVTLEAMACGLPVIGFNGGGTAELITHNNDGILYNNHQQLVDAMLLLASDTDLCKQLGIAGKSKIETDFDIDLFGKKIASIIKKKLIR
jgi:glycosyltransferase involved in cell wall biosynthesis